MAQWAKIRAGWKRFSDRAAEIFSIALFSVLYFVAFAPMALALKLFGRRFLADLTGNHETYYSPKDKIEPTMEYMRRQW